MIYAKILSRWCNAHALILGIIITSILLLPAQGRAVETSTVSEIHSHSNEVAPQVLLPAVRRVGIDSPVSNVAEFRKFMRNQAHSIIGFLALPLGENELSTRISKILEAEVQETGRFWSLSVDATFDLLASSMPEQVQKKAREKLVKNYDLDAWISTRITFLPDHTTIRLALRSSKGSNPIWAREDIFVEPQATIAELEQGMKQALARLIKTLGADGAVTFATEQMMVVDFGQERGVAPGTKLEAGLVILSAYHPQSHEFLRSKSVPLYRLEVTEVRDGSSLCKVLEKNAVATADAEDIYGLDMVQTGKMLAWTMAPLSDAGWASDSRWKESLSEPFPLIDAAESGFEMPKKKKLPRVRIAQNTEKETSPREPIAHPDAVRDTQEPSDGLIKNHDGNSQPSPKETSDFPKIESVSGGLAVNFGTLSTDRGKRYTNFPSTVLSSATTEATLVLDEGLFLFPSLQFDSFNGGDVTGSQFDVSAPFGVALWKSPSSLEVFYGGGGLAVGMGNVKTVLVKKDLGRFDLLGFGRYENSGLSFGKFRTQGSISVLDLFSGALAGDFELGVNPSKFFPRELEFGVRIRKGPEDWMQYSFGILWEFMADLRAGEKVH